MKVSERFWAKVEKTPGCWRWRGQLLRSGYGRFSVGRRSVRAHVFAYEQEYGAVPNGLCLDHLCRNKVCVNPQHLEAVTSRENTLRGIGLTAQNARKTHCPNGHAYDAINTYIYNGRWRNCRACRAQAEAARRSRMRSGGGAT